MAPAQLIFALVTAVIGFLCGVLINWLADDLPHQLRLTAIHYPDGTARPRLAWSGTLAFVTGKRSAPGGARLSWRYPLVEIGLALLFIYIALAYPLSLRSAFWMGNCAILMLITVIDLEHRLILYSVIIPSCVFALIGSAATGSNLFQDYLIGGLVGFGLFFIFYFGGILFVVVAANARGESVDEVAFGFGDVMLATLAGFMLGWQALIFAVMITVFLGALGAILYLVVQLVGRGKYEMFTALPYGQYIVLGTLIMMLWRDPIRMFLQGR
jgi:prepilin signal peptidase PulO-like enzyme (type II secretory pathway)